MRTYTAPEIKTLARDLGYDIILQNMMFTKHESNIDETTRLIEYTREISYNTVQFE